MKRILLFISIFITSYSLFSQDYYFEKFKPFNESIPSPEEFLGYEIGAYHTRHDRIVAYLEKLGEVSERASLMDYGKTHELRRLVILQISTTQHISNLENLRSEHVKYINPNFDLKGGEIDIPVFVNLGYNVHGNEPSSSEAAMLAAYVLVASEHPDIQRYRQDAVIFVDPTINPDGRERHTQWANSFRGSPQVADPMDAEHNETWPRGRTNHYWFDLNRDWLLAVHPESQGKLDWYHNWYPNVVTDFHEMGSNSSYFFEPMKFNASLNPIMPEENYTTLNELFATYYQKEMDELGSLYFTKEVFDGTYPGYGSSYPDLQGGLGVLFEQASSRGLVQNTDMGQITFPFTIRNQFVNSIATVAAAAENKDLLYSYQNRFFKSALTNAQKSGIQSYVFGEKIDISRTKAFIEMLQRHRIKVYHLTNSVQINGKQYEQGSAFVVPTQQPQYRMVQTMFETYSEYRDSVYYDASAWSLANAYNMNYQTSRSAVQIGAEVQLSDFIPHNLDVEKTDYAYVIPWHDYDAPAMLHNLQSKDLMVMAAQKSFTIETNAGVTTFLPGALVIPVQHQSLGKDKIHMIIEEASIAFSVPISSLNTGYSKSGIDLGSRYIDALEPPKAFMLIGDGASSYESGFVWHLLDQRVGMPITKVKTNMIRRLDFSKYNSMILVSGNYATLDSAMVDKIKDWISEGNTLITIGRGTSWAINKKIVNESLVKGKEEEKDTAKIQRHPYILANEIKGKNEVGGAIFEIDLDLTHPIGFGYSDKNLPIYRNNSVWINPSKSPYNNVAVYSEDPHIDGYITDEILNKKLKKSASIVVSKVGSGRTILFAEDPNFRGTWYGTNKLFLNALFFGDLIRVP